MGLELLLVGLYFTFVGGFEWSFLCLLIPIILVFIIPEIRSRVHFFLRVIIALIFHIIGRLRAGLAKYRELFVTVSHLFQGVLSFSSISLLPVFFAILLYILSTIFLFFTIRDLLS